MGKSLIVKGADFSANGIGIIVILGTLTKTNESAVLNSYFQKENIEALNPSGSSIKVMVGTDNAAANASMVGKSVNYIKTTNPYSAYGAAVWGKPITIDLANLGNVFVQNTQTNAFENVKIWLKVIEG